MPCDQGRYGRLQVMREGVGLIDPDIWQQSGGLLGLVIFAIFLCAALLVYTMFKGFFMMQQWHREDMNSIRSAHTAERDRWIGRMDEMQEACVEKFGKLVNRYESHLKPPGRK